MANGAVITLAATEFESDHLVVLELINDFGGDFRTVHKRGTNLNFAAIGDEKNLGKIDVRADFRIELFDLDLIAGFHAVLFAAGLNNCVCHKKLGLSRVVETGGNRNLCKHYVLIFWFSGVRDAKEPITR